MDFNFTPEQIELKQKVSAFAEKELKPDVAAMDEVEIGKAADMVAKQIEKLAQAGYLGLGFPTELGGAGADLLSATVMMEELGRFCPATALSLVYSVAACARAILLYGSDAQKQKYLPSLLQGKILGAFAHQEPDGGYHFWELTGAAVAADQGYTLTGQKSLTVNAPLAAVYLVPMYTDRNAGPEKGLSIFLVEKDSPGLTLSAAHEKIGCRATPSAGLELKNCLVPKDALLAEAGTGYDMLKTIKAYEHLAMAACAVGINNACLQNAALYVKDHLKGGEPMLRHQEISFKLADMQLTIDTAHMLIYRTVWMLETANPEASVLASCAKLFAAETAAQSAANGLQIFETSGLLKGSPGEMIFRNAKLGEIIADPSEAHRLRIAREVLAQTS